MNSRLFACTDCKQYINAGGRWCFQHLERSGLLTARQPVDVDQVLSCDRYWNPGLSEGQSPYGGLSELLPQVSRFLSGHRKHRILFGEPGNDDFLPDDPHEALLWDDVEAGEPFDLSARTLVRQKGYRTWKEVEVYMRERKYPVWWWEQQEVVDVARRRFEACVVEETQR